jgi:hypothetical protein
MITSQALCGSFGIVMTALAVGCGGGGGGSGSTPVDFTALHAAYASPTGKLGAADVGAVATSLDKQSQTAGVPVTMSAKVGLQGLPGSSLRLQNGGANCGESGGDVSCTCPGGGSFAESGVSSQGGVVQATIDYSSCVYDDSGSSNAVSISGSLSFADYSSSPPMMIYSGTIDETVTPPGTTETIDMNFALLDGVITYDVSISSGNVLVQDSGSWDPSTDTGSFTVIDQSGSWSCQLTNGAGTCTGSGGQTIQVG